MIDQIEDFFRRFFVQGRPVLLGAEVGKAPFPVIIAESAVVGKEIGIDSAYKK